MVCVPLASFEGMKPSSRYYLNTRIYFILNDDLREEIDESVKTICARYGVPVIELTAIDKISGHPSVKGMRQIADQVNSFLKSNAAPAAQSAGK